jgi:hypothetical protein
MGEQDVGSYGVVARTQATVPRGISGADRHSKIADGGIAPPHRSLQDCAPRERAQPSTERSLPYSAVSLNPDMAC